MTKINCKAGKQKRAVACEVRGVRIFVTESLFVGGEKLFEAVDEEGFVVARGRSIIEVICNVKS